MIMYKSTRGSQNYKTASQAVIQGIAEDKGLYVPERVPALPVKIEELVGKPYKDVAFAKLARRPYGYFYALACDVPLTLEELKATLYDGGIEVTDDELLDCLAYLVDSRYVVFVSGRYLTLAVRQEG